jgi:beta-aspartyl-peptidase (threonine type)
MGWAIAIHGGAGTIKRTMPAERIQELKGELAAALKRGSNVLATGGSALDAVEAAVVALEDADAFNAGKGAVFNREGEHELDASIMDGRTLGCGVVGAARRMKNPIRVARLVMEKTPHILLVGPGADDFASEHGAELVDNDYFATERRREQWKKFAAQDPKGLSRSEDDTGDAKGTVGAVAVDRDGNVATATSTGGLTNKLPGRVGDTGVIGAGTYADNETAAVSCTGHGEAFVRRVVAHAVCERMRLFGEPLDAAAQDVVANVMKAGEGGLIAVDARGNVAMPFNCEGMYRGCADERGRFEVHIWEAVGRGVDPAVG